MPNFVLATLFLCLFSLNTFALNPAKETPQLTILLYHHIHNNTPESTSTSPDLFKAHLEYLNDNNFAVLPLERALDKLYKKESLPNKAVAITFDDGYRSILTHALPVLKKFDYPFTVFVATNDIKDSSELMLNWKELQFLSTQNAAIANHSVTHSHLLENKFTKKYLLEELEHSDKVLSQYFKRAPALFAYPFGEFNNELKTMVSDKAWYGLSQVSGPATHYTPKTAIPRFAFAGQYSGMEQFKLKMNTLAMPVISQTPNDPHLNDDPSYFELQFEHLPFHQASFQCYFNGEPVHSLKWINKYSVQIQLKKPLQEGRSRINCTAPSIEKARFYWHSIPIFKTPSSGIWPN